MKSDPKIKIKCHQLNLNHSINIANLFAHLADKPWAIWLDSCFDLQGEKHPNSQFDIIAWQPVLTLCNQNNKTIIDIKEKTLFESPLNTPQHSPIQLIEQIQTLLSEKIECENHYNLPFNGGLLGYFAYDLGRQFESIPELADNDIDCPDMAVGFYYQAIVYDHIHQQLYLICEASKVDTLQTEIKQWLTTSKQQKPFSLTSDWASNMSQEDYQEKFNQVQQYLLAGDCYQINLAQRFNAAYSGDEFAAYLAIRSENKAPFSAFMRLPSCCILSVSPERFIQHANGHVQTKPIKGTLPRALDEEQDKFNANFLLHSSKDRAENLMIVDLLRNDISRVCQAGSVKVTELFAIESFPAVHHLVSTIEGRLKDSVKPTTLLQASFPGGSITGAPKIRAMEIIEQLEPHRRSIYCGSIGYIAHNGNMDTSITIRTLICSNNQIYSWAGGGLVADSTVENEYQETYDKVNKILPVLSHL